MTLCYEDVVQSARAEEGRWVSVTREGDIAVVTMEDPSHMNALSAPLTVRLLDCLSQLVADPGVRAVILTGAPPAFSAGGDLRAMQSVAHRLVDESPDGATGLWRWIRSQFGGVVRLITHADKIFVAALGGVAAGVGLSFAFACDLIIASEEARLLLAFGRIGLVPEVGMSWLLTRRLGYQKTMELFLGGGILTAAEAERLGLVNEVVPPGAELARAREWCHRAGALPPHAVAMAKPLLRQAADMTWDQAIAMEEFAEPMCFTTRSHREAVRSLLEKKQS